MANNAEPVSQGWSLNKSVPAAYIAAIIFQTVVFLVIGTAWVTQTNARLDRLEEFMKASIAIQARLAVLESRMTAIDRIEVDIRTLLRQNQPPSRQ